MLETLRTSPRTRSSESKKCSRPYGKDKPSLRVASQCYVIILNISIVDMCLKYIKSNIVHVCMHGHCRVSGHPVTSESVCLSPVASHRLSGGGASSILRGGASSPPPTISGTWPSTKRGVSSPPYRGPTPCSPAQDQGEWGSVVVAVEVVVLSIPPVEVRVVVVWWWWWSRWWWWWWL